MKRGERGFTLIEVLVVIAIAALITLGATTTTFQVFNVTRHSNDHIAVVRQVQNAGYWISRDALMAESVVVDGDPETDEFLTLKWTEWDFGKKKDLVVYYHEVTYFFQDLPDDIGKLDRTHWINDEVNEQTLVAEYIDYNTNATYDTSVLTVQITSSLGEASETREYRVLPRPDF